MPDKSSGPPDSPENLDLVLGWMQKNLDDLKVATQRVQELSVRPAVDLGALGPGMSSLPAPETAAPATGPAADPSPAAGPSAAAASASVTVDQLAPAPSSGAGSKPTPLLDKIGRDLTKLADGGLASARSSAARPRRRG